MSQILRRALADAMLSQMKATAASNRTKFKECKEDGFFEVGLFDITMMTDAVLDTIEKLAPKEAEKYAKIERAMTALHQAMW